MLKGNLSNPRDRDQLLSRMARIESDETIVFRQDDDLSPTWFRVEGRLLFLGVDAYRTLRGAAVADGVDVDRLERDHVSRN